MRARPDQIDTSTSSLVGKRILWVAVLGVWMFLTASLVSFHLADPPSAFVSPPNDPVLNWCGVAGAVIAYHAFAVLGVGSWAVVVSLAGLLIVTASGRSIDHPTVRILGVGLVVLAISGLHALIVPDRGPIPALSGGLLPFFIVSELLERFNPFGTWLFLVSALAIGTIVAADRLVLAFPRLVSRGVHRIMSVRSKLPGFASIPRPQMPQMRFRISDLVRSVLSLLPRKGRRGSWPAVENEAVEPVSTGRRSRRGARSGGSRISADAGGIGAVESFDPDAHEVDDSEVADESAEVEDVEMEDDDAPAFEEPSRSTRRTHLTKEQLREKMAKLPVRMASNRNKSPRDQDIPREENFEGYQFPTLELLEDPERNYSEKLEKYVREQAQTLEEALHTFGIDGEVVGIDSGPVITLYAVELAPGTKVSKVQAISSDIARSLRAQNIRIVPNMAGRTSIGIEVPNQQKEKVRLKELMSGGHADGMGLPMFLGKDASGEPLVSDLTKMPHMLIAGTTGSGKSVCMNTIIMSWLYTKRPDELKLVLVDPKMVELSQFQHIPHLMCPVVTEMGKAAAILEWAVTKMEERYELLKEAMVRDIASYNALGEEELYERMEATDEAEQVRIPKKLPYMVFVIDELADLMMTNKEVEQSIVRIAQKARAVGIHLILATQRPQANVVTGLIKSNMPCRISFRVASGMDSRIVLDHKGAELLLGQGDMMFLAPHTSELRRSQGTLVTDQEIRRVAKFLKEVAAPTFERSLITLRSMSEEPEDPLASKERDPLFDDAVRVIIESGRGSVSLLQRRMSIGYGRASRLVDQMALAGMLGDHKGSVAREVLITLEEWEQMKQMEAEGTLFAEDTDEADADDSDVAVVETMNDSDDAEFDAVPVEYADEYRS